MQIFSDGVPNAPCSVSFFDMSAVPSAADATLRSGRRRWALEGESAPEVIDAIRQCMRTLWVDIHIGDLEVDVETGGDDGSEWQCVVCLEGDEEEDAGASWRARMRCCGVVFHGRCLARILASGMACPTCRSDRCPFCSDDDCVRAFNC